MENYTCAFLLCLLTITWLGRGERQCNFENNIKYVSLCEDSEQQGTNIAFSTTGQFENMTGTCTCNITAYGNTTPSISFKGPQYESCGIAFKIQSLRFTCTTVLQFQLETLQSAEVRFTKNVKETVAACFQLSYINVVPHSTDVIHARCHRPDGFKTQNTTTSVPITTNVPITTTVPKTTTTVPKTTTTVPKTTEKTSVPTTTTADPKTTTTVTKTTTTVPKTTTTVPKTTEKTSVPTTTTADPKTTTTVTETTTTVPKTTTTVPKTTEKTSVPTTTTADPKTTTTTPVPTTTTTTTTAVPKTTTTGTNDGLITAAVVSGVFVLILALIIIIQYLRKPKAEYEKFNATNDDTSATGGYDDYVITENALYNVDDKVGNTPGDEVRQPDYDTEVTDDSSTAHQPGDAFHSTANKAEHSLQDDSINSQQSNYDGHAGYPETSTAF